MGMTFLSGAPKIRKSFLALQMAIAVATGTPLFGRATTQCDVAYLDLEGSKHRISARSGRMTTRIPRNVFITNQIPSRLADTLIEDIRTLHRGRPTMCLFIIDTYSRSRGNVKGTSANAYDQDVALLEPMQRMAVEENIAVVFVHHDRKGAGLSSDSFERLSGTMGISGSADCVINLVAEGKRFDGKATMEFNPRDAKGGELKLEFSQQYGEWVEIVDFQPDLMGNPICAWIVNNAPEARKEGVFYSYNAVSEGAYGLRVDKPGTLVPAEILRWKKELYESQGIAVQVGVKSHDKRGIRLLRT